MGDRPALMEDVAEGERRTLRVVVVQPGGDEQREIRDPPAKRRAPVGAEAVDEHGEEHAADRDLVREKARAVEDDTGDMPGQSPPAREPERPQGAEQAARVQADGDMGIPDGQPEPVRVRRRKEHEQKPDCPCVQALHSKRPRHAVDRHRHEAGEGDGDGDVPGRVRAEEAVHDGEIDRFAGSSPGVRQRGPEEITGEREEPPRALVLRGPGPVVQLEPSVRDVRAEGGEGGTHEDDAGDRGLRERAPASGEEIDAGE